MRKPTSVKIGAHTYKIVYRSFFGQAHIGFCYYRSKKIEIQRDLGGRMLTETLLHEVMHGIWYEWGTCNSEMSVENYAARVATEETAVNNLSNGLCAVFRDNPGFRAFIIHNLA